MEKGGYNCAGSKSKFKKLKINNKKLEICYTKKTIRRSLVITFCSRSFGCKSYIWAYHSFESTMLHSERLSNIGSLNSQQPFVLQV
jgi:hypothetical protein